MSHLKGSNPDDLYARTACCTPKDDYVASIAYSTGWTVDEDDVLFFIMGRLGIRIKVLLQRHATSFGRFLSRMVCGLEVVNSNLTWITSGRHDVRKDTRLPRKMGGWVVGSETVKLTWRRPSQQL